MRCSNPSGPGSTLSENMRALHCEQRGRWIGSNSGSDLRMTVTRMTGTPKKLARVNGFVCPAFDTNLALLALQTDGNLAKGSNVGYRTIPNSFR